MVINRSITASKEAHMFLEADFESGYSNGERESLLRA